MTADDREDLIHTAGVLKWGDLTDVLRDELQAAFYAGFQAESKYYLS